MKHNSLRKLETSGDSNKKVCRFYCEQETRFLHEIQKCFITKESPSPRDKRKSKAVVYIMRAHRVHHFLASWWPNHTEWSSPFTQRLARRAGANLQINEESFSFFPQNQDTKKDNLRHIQTLDSNNGRVKAALTVERAIILWKEHNKEGCDQ